MHVKTNLFVFFSALLRLRDIAHPFVEFIFTVDYYVLLSPISGAKRDELFTPHREFPTAVSNIAFYSFINLPSWEMQ